MNEQANSPRPHPNLWFPPKNPSEDYPLTEPNHPPASTAGGPVRFPKPADDDSTIPSEPTDFQDFAWDVVNAIARVNSGLFAYKKGRAMGFEPEEARKLYDAAVENYRRLREKWSAEMAEELTWIKVATSPDGYVTEVIIRSRAFSVHTPGQSESHNSTNPPRRT